jgi:hypothetical protein
MKDTIVVTNFRDQIVIACALEDYAQKVGPWYVENPSMWTCEFLGALRGMKAMDARPSAGLVRLAESAGIDAYNPPPAVD